MTAEVGILNRVGVALAADSAVTIGQAADKIWTSADKLFQLSEADPVGIMVYGNAEFLSVPWETVIKCFRSCDGCTSRATVREYVDTFIRFLENNAEMFPDERRERESLAIVEGLWLSLREHCREELDREAEQRDGLEEHDVTAVLAREIASLTRIVRSKSRLPSFPPSLRRKIRNRYGESLLGLRGKIFGHLPLGRSSLNALVSIAVNTLARYMFSPASTGVVFAGFGAREHFPTLIELEVEGMCLGKVRYAEVKNIVIDEDQDASIVPFAQQEMVHSFMQGVDPELFNFLQRATSQVLHGFLETFDRVFALLPALNDGATEEVRELRARLGSVQEALFKDWDDQRSAHWRPVVMNIATLPKDELAAMAEAFVNLTKFRRRVSVERETVGGPIDVAVITKGDGFVWIKRKHYFDAILNPRFMARFGVKPEAR